MNDLIYVRPWVYEKQRQAIFNNERYALIEASTKTGKTVGCIIWLFEQAAQGRPGNNFWWVAPVSDQANIAFERIRRFMPRDIYEPNLTKNYVTLSNDCRIWFKSADKPDSLYGEDVYAGVIDEASRVKDGAFHAVRSTLTATRGKLRIIGNVKGRKNWFYGLSRKAQAGEPGYHYAKLTAYDAAEAGVLDYEEIEDAKRTLPENVFRELYLAEPSDDGGNPFGIAHIDACASMERLSGNAACVWGWDLAKSVDWTVGVGLDDHGQLAQFHRFQKPWPETIETIIALTGSTPALVDSTGVGDPVLDMLQKQRGNFEGFKFTHGSKQKLMEGLATAIQSKSVSFPRNELYGELCEFEYAYTRTGAVYTAPEGYHDDSVMALALAVYHKNVNNHAGNHDFNKLMDRLYG